MIYQPISQNDRKGIDSKLITYLIASIEVRSAVISKELGEVMLIATDTLWNIYLAHKYNLH